MNLQKSVRSLRNSNKHILDSFPAYQEEATIYYMKQNTNFKIILAFAAIYIIWGTTYLAVRIGLETIPPFLMASMRYILAGLILLAYCFFRGEPIFSGKPLQKMLLGAFILTLGQAVLFWCEKYISSGLTSVFGSTLPIWYIVADRRNWKNYFTSNLTLFSIALGLFGIIILFIHPAESGTADHNAGFMAIVASVAAIASCLCWAAGSLYYNYQKKSGSLFENVGWQLMGGTISCFIVSSLSGEWKHFSFSAVSWSGWLATLYLAIAGSIVAISALFWLLARRPAPIVGTYAYINPVIAVLLGYFIAKETISVTQVIGMVIILIAAWLANSVKFQSAE